MKKIIFKDLRNNAIGVIKIDSLNIMHLKTEQFSTTIRANLYIETINHEMIHIYSGDEYSMFHNDLADKHLSIFEKDKQIISEEMSTLLHGSNGDVRFDLLEDRIKQHKKNLDKKKTTLNSKCSFFSRFF